MAGQKQGWFIKYYIFTTKSMGGCVGVTGIASATKKKSSSRGHGKEIPIDPLVLKIENIENPSQQELKRTTQILEAGLQILKAESYTEEVPLSPQIFKVIDVLRNEELTKYTSTSDIIRYHYQTIKYLYFYGKDEECLPNFAELQKKREKIEEEGFSWLNIKLFKLMIIYRIKLKFAESSKEISFTEQCMQILPLLTSPLQKQMMLLYILSRHYYLSIKYKIQEKCQIISEKERQYLEEENKNLSELQKQLKNIKQKTMRGQISQEFQHEKQFFEEIIGFDNLKFPSFSREISDKMVQDAQRQHHIQIKLRQIKSKEKGECYQKLSKSTFYLWEKNQISSFLSTIDGADRKKSLIFPFMNINAMYLSSKSEDKRIRLYKHKKYVSVGAQLWEKLHYFGSGMILHFFSNEKHEKIKLKEMDVQKQIKNKKLEVENQNGDDLIEYSDERLSSSTRNEKEKQKKGKQSSLFNPEKKQAKSTVESKINTKGKKYSHSEQEQNKTLIKLKEQKSSIADSKNIVNPAPRTGEFMVNNEGCSSKSGIKCSQTLKYSNYTFNQSVPSRNQYRKSFGFSSYYEAGGLENIGNTCYLNSALQCLHKTIPFQQNFWNHIIQNKIFQKGIKPLSSEYYQLIGILWDQRKRETYRPENIKNIIAQSNLLFEAFKQNDAMECLNTFLQVIGEELNTAPQQVLKVKIDHGKMSDSQIYQKTKAKNEAKEKSIIDDTFTGRYKTTYQCAHCGQLYTLFEKFNIHYIPLPPPPEKKYLWSRSHHDERKPKLIECLRSFQNAEYMAGDDRMNCARCQRDMETKKKMAIYKANKVLVIGLKRFHQGQKNDIKIDIPLQLDPSHFVECKNEYRNKVYKLYAVLLHSGTLRGGHYKAVCYNPQLKVQSWMEYDDSYVRRCSIKDICEQNVYGIFYSLADRQETKKYEVQSQVHQDSHYRRQRQN